jgi:uncharacterized membrane protein YdjX (TVP38/TMEM64 family)
MKPGEPQVRRDAWVNLTAIVAAALVVGLAFIPGTLLSLATQAILRLQ